MFYRLFMIALFSQEPSALAEQRKPEQFLPPEVLKACPSPMLIAPYIKGCTTNFIAVEWAKSCSQALDKLSKNANAQLQRSFAEEASKSHGGQSGNLGNTSADLAQAKLSFDQLMAAGKMFLANQKVYQSLVAYPGGENKALIEAFGLTKIYTSFNCVKSSLDAVEAEIVATRKKISELETGGRAANALWKETDRRDESLNGTLNGSVARPAVAPGSPAQLPPVRGLASKPDANTVTGIDKALEDKRKAEKILQQQK